MLISYTKYEFNPPSQLNGRRYINPKSPVLQHPLGFIGSLIFLLPFLYHLLNYVGVNIDWNDDLSIILGFCFFIFLWIGSIHSFLSYCGYYYQCVQFDKELKKEDIEVRSGVIKFVYDDLKEIPKSGFNTYTFGNGITYEGKWKGGVRHGQGKEMDKYGNIIKEGVWEKGTFLTDPNTDPLLKNILTKNQTIKKTKTISNSIDNDKILDQIKKLSQLKDEGILTVEEFENKKTELLKKL